MNYRTRRDGLEKKDSEVIAKAAAQVAEKVNLDENEIECTVRVKNRIPINLCR